MVDPPAGFDYVSEATYLCANSYINYTTNAGHIYDKTYKYKEVVMVKNFVVSKPTESSPKQEGFDFQGLVCYPLCDNAYFLCDSAYSLCSSTYSLYDSA